MFRRITAGFGVMAVVGLVFNLAFWAGLIYFALWALKHFGVI